MLATPFTCNDWLLVCGDAHYAQDQLLFSSYKSVENHATVKGIGNVELLVAVYDDSKKNSSLIVLQNVLYIPSAKCNGIRISLNSWRMQNGLFNVLDEAGAIIFSGSDNGKGLLRLHLYDHNGTAQNVAIDSASLYLPEEDRRTFFAVPQCPVVVKK